MSTGEYKKKIWVFNQETVSSGKNNYSPMSHPSFLPLSRSVNNFSYDAMLMLMLLHAALIQVWANCIAVMSAALPINQASLCVCVRVHVCVCVYLCVCVWGLHY